MSYDVYLNCPTCKHNPIEGINPTYNLTPIFDFALTGEDCPNPDVAEGQSVVLKAKTDRPRGLRAKTDRPRGLRVLNGRKAGDTLIMIDNALKRLRDPELRDKFDDMLPTNGWGSFDGAVSTFKEMRAMAEEYPNSIWEIR